MKISENLKIKPREFPHIHVVQNRENYGIYS